MKNTYTTPTLVSKGNVAEITRNTEQFGLGDPIDSVQYKLVQTGSVGFQL